MQKHIGLGTILITLLMLSTYPYMFNLLIGLPDEKIVWIAFFVIISVAVLFSSKRARLMPSPIVVCMGVQVIMWFFFMLYHEDTSYFTRIFFIIFVFLCLKLLISRDEVQKFGLSYVYILTAQAVLGGVAFILIYLDVLQAVAVLQLDSLKSFSCYILTCSNSVYGNFIRVGGYFDEPGALAAWGFYALIINKLVFDNRRVELILGVSLLFTFSAAYFILLPLYILGFYSSNLKKLFPVVILIVAIGYVSLSYLGSNETFKALTFERFEGGEIQSARNIYSENAKAYYEKNKAFGVGSQNFGALYTSSDNPYEILAKDGCVGYIVTYLPFIIMLLLYRKKEVYVAILLLMICYMQRPFHINFMHYFMIYFIFLIIDYKNRVKAGGIISENRPPIIPALNR